MEILSPLTGTNDVTELEKFDVSKIICAYSNELDIKVDGYFKGLAHISLYRCNVTGYRFYFPFFIEADSSFYEQLMLKKKLYYPGWKWENQVASRYIRETDKILDVGCGDGAFISELSKRIKVSAEGLEFNPAALQKAKDAGLLVFQETVQNYALVKKSQFDVVCSFQVVEHIAHLKSFLSAKLDLLKTGGLMIIGVPYSNPYLYRKDKYHTLNLPPHHMGLWNEKAFENLTKIFKIEVKEILIERVDDLTYYTFAQLGMLKGYKSLLSKSKGVQTIARLFNKFRLPSYLLKGRNIVVVFKKL